MKRITCAALAAWAILTTVVCAGGEPYRSPLALASHGDRLYAADATAARVVVFHAKKGRVLDEYPTPAAPSGVCVSPDGRRLYVTAGAADGRVLLLHANSGRKIGEINVGYAPTSPVVSPDGATLYVCNQFTNDVSVCDLAARKETLRIPVTREPVAAAITPDGRILVVANLLPSGAANSGYAAAAVELIDVAAGAVSVSLKLPNGSTDLRGVCLSPDGAFAYVTHLVSRYQLPTTQIERGWVNTNALSIIDVNAAALVNTVLLDDVDLGAANPWGVACSQDGLWLVVAHAGSHEISIIQRGALHEKLNRSVADGAAASVINDLSYMTGLRERCRLQGKGPRGLGVLGSRIYAAEYYSGSLGMVDLEQPSPRQAQELPLGHSPEPDAVRAGEMLFHDADPCFQRWQSCASCHPGDARVDALNWDMLNDGLGTPKNTKSLLLAHQTPPAMATGIRETAEIAVRAGIRNSLFSTLGEAQAVELDEYLKSLKPLPSPRLVQGGLSPAAERGRQVFEAAECSSCHPAPLFTDLKKHTVGTVTSDREARKLDTPSLIELWRTAPYLHDGQAASIREVITTCNPGDGHGSTKKLTVEQLDDLEAYVLSL